MTDTLGHRKLVVWQRAMDLIPNVYLLIKQLPKEERFGLADQMRRASVSIAANIAEGHGRNGKKEFVYFLGISQGSASELDTLIDAAVRLKFVTHKEAESVSDKIVDVRKLLFGLQTSLKRQ